MAYSTERSTQSPLEIINALREKLKVRTMSSWAQSLQITIWWPGKVDEGNGWKWRCLISTSQSNSPTQQGGELQSSTADTLPTSPVSGQQDLKATQSSAALSVSPDFSPFSIVHLFLFSFSFCLFFCWGRVSLCSPGYPKTHYVA